MYRFLTNKKRPRWIFVFYFKHILLFDGMCGCLYPRPDLLSSGNDELWVQYEAIFGATIGTDLVCVGVGRVSTVVVPVAADTAYNAMLWQKLVV